MPIESNIKKQVIFSILLICLIVIWGTAGYAIIEGWGIFESLYTTIITITTIGTKDMYELSPMGRVFTIFLIVGSVGAVFYVLSNTARILVEGELKDIFQRRKLQRRINKMSGHYIVCGYGRMGKIVARELFNTKSKFVVVEKSPEVISSIEEDIDCIIGDASKDEVLKSAGIERAKGLIAVLPTDAENIYVVLSAKGLNPSLKIVARASEEGAEQKLLRAGADKVVSPYHEGGIRIAHTVLKPAVVDFIEVATKSGSIDLQMEEVKVEEGSKIAEQTLDECGIGRELGVIVVAIKSPTGQMKINPSYRTKIHKGDTLIALGEVSKLKALEDAASKRA